MIVGTEKGLIMDTAKELAEATPSKTAPQDLPVVALASAVALTAATGLLIRSLFPGGRRRASLAGQVCLGALAACAAAVIWSQRQQEISAARHLITHIHEVRDTRWLKKHPVAYG
jgi:hypothetical protein